MPRPKNRFCLSREEVLRLLGRMRLKEALLLSQALGLSPEAIPARAESLKRAMRRMAKAGAGSEAPTENTGKPRKPADSLSGETAKTGGQTVLLASDEHRAKPRAKPQKRADNPSGEKAKTGEQSVRYPDPAGALAQELGGWRAAFLFRARKLKNRPIQELAHAHREVLLAFMDLAEALPSPRRIPAALAWLEDTLGLARLLGDEAVIQVFREVQKRAPENPLSYADKVLKGLAEKRLREEAVWTPTGESF